MLGRIEYLENQNILTLCESEESSDINEEIEDYDYNIMLKYSEKTGKLICAIIRHWSWVRERMKEDGVLKDQGTLRHDLNCYLNRVSKVTAAPTENRTSTRNAFTKASWPSRLLEPAALMKSGK